MTDELKKALLEDNIQCIKENDGKFVFIRTRIVATSTGYFFPISSLFSREIPVGSILILKTLENETLKTLVFVCCNASQKTVSQEIVKNNLFWFEISLSSHYISPA
nr:MAG TPA: hypothetical protein [Caudoviricetes sp.]